MQPPQQPFQIIPVLDLKQGRVVSAQRGDRENYQPLHSPLCRSSDVFDVLSAFLKLYPFPVFYIADLDALTKTGDQQTLILHLLQAFPEKIFWIDCGFQQSVLNNNYPKNLIPVLGSESFTADNYHQIKHVPGPFILSLDFSADQTAMGTDKLFNHSALWPNRIIIMTLAKVGSHSGPDLQILQHYCQRFPEKQFIAAGGVRDKNDILALKKTGISHALVASALHSGMLKTEDFNP